MVHLSLEMIMAQTREPGDNIIDPWCPLEAWPAEQRPATLWSWLADAGSLTQKLRALAGDVFQVRVLYEGQAPLDAEDARLLHAAAGTTARERQVYLCADALWVYARTLVPTESGHWLEKLGTHPLGERVFAVADTHRNRIEVAQLYPEHKLYQTALNGLGITPPMLWARRSVLRVDSSHLLIYECFLPGMHA